MKNYQKYFEKNGFIYGVSYKVGQSNSGYCKKFTNLDEATDWLDIEEFDFRTRELCSKTRAEKLTSKKEVSMAATMEVE